MSEEEFLEYDIEKAKEAYLQFDAFWNGVEFATQLDRPSYMQDINMMILEHKSVLEARLKKLKGVKMTDISKCVNGCKKQEFCYRFTAKANEYYQAYSDFEPDENGECDGFWDSRGKE